MLIKCFAMVKDEIDIIEDWLRYAIDLFDPGNVYVLDDESSDGTTDVLRHYQREVWSERVKSRAEGPGKGELLTRLMRDQSPHCDLLVPLDADEFIGMQNSWNRASILEEFGRLDLEAYGRFKFTLTYQAIPSINETPFPIRSLTNFSVTSYEFFGDTYKDFAKTFFSAKWFKSTDNGNHRGESSLSTVVHTPLWIYHYHARSLDQFRRKILRGAIYTNYWTNYRFSRHWQRAYQAHLAGRFDELFENKLSRLPKHRKALWPAYRLRALDADSRLPARLGPCEPKSPP